MKLRCSQCGASTEAKCECGVAYLPAGAFAAEAVAKNPEAKPAQIARETGVSYMTAHRAVANVTSLPNGKKNSKKNGKKKSAAERAYQCSIDNGIKFDVSILPPSPIGRMPDDTKEQMEASIKIIKEQWEKLFWNARYADQMSNELRHLLADELRGLSSHLREVSYTLLGGKDWRKITRPWCNEEIPLRKEDTNWN
jgi:hypothetical protein